MCGIYFYYGYDSLTGKTKLVLVENFNKINHRGPDASRIRYYNDNTMMGFKRLAIVDPTGEGMQPFEEDYSSKGLEEDYESRFACVVNGEIYNYKELQNEYKFPLTSNSDCEIVLHLFMKIVGFYPYSSSSGTVSVEHLSKLCSLLDGEFAFIIYNTLTQETYYGVDELRCRPLFLGIAQYQYIEKGVRRDLGCGYICLASEQKAIVECSHIVAVPSATVGIIRSFRTKNKQLEPLPESFYTHHTYFDLGSVKQIQISFDQAVKDLRTLLIQNVAKKLNSDREFGFLLSGGLDSSVVCDISTFLLSTRIKTFTGGFTADAPDIIAARKVAKAINSIHTEFIFTFQEGIDALREVIKFLETWDQTTIRAGIIMYLTLRAIKKKHPEMAVIYSGEISDEQFMGYLEWSMSPGPEESRNHVIKRLKDITYFDGLRADRMVASVGCELRLPFFGKEILNFVLSLPPEYLMPEYHDGIEKYLLRRACDHNTSKLPKEILWRTKHAFSDATSIVGKSSWKEHLKAYAEREIADSRFACAKKLYPHSTPQTKEDMLYREIFDEYGYKDTTIPYKWLPEWAPKDLTDASATALVGFKE